MHVIITDELQECLTTCTSCSVQKHMETVKKALQVKKRVTCTVRPHTCSHFIDEMK
jgi:archaellum biogenesis ATPase FlaH